MSKETKTVLKKINEYSKRHNVEVYRQMPTGYSAIPGASTAPVGAVWVGNGKSRFDSERKVAMLLETWLLDDIREQCEFCEKCSK